MALTFAIQGTDGLSGGLARHVHFDGSPDALGCQWFGKVDGWDTPPLDLPTGQRPNGHGAVIGSPLLQARTMTLSGYMQAPDVVALRDRRDMLIRVMTNFESLRVLMSSENRFCSVALNGTILLRNLSEQVLQFSIPLIAPNPLKRGGSRNVQLKLGQAVAGAVFPLTFPLALAPDTAKTMLNEGTFPSPLNIQIYGPVTNPALLNTKTGQRIAFALTLASSDMLNIDTAEGFVLRNGVPARRFLTPDSILFDLPVGSTGLLFTASAYSPTPTCVVGGADTYL